ncbi:MAG: PhzF family phenazine biosynthesis protein [Bacteroidota bacterium]
MKLPLYQVDAFAKERFSGNPAAVCPLEDWLPDSTLQAIALENNLSETAFIVPQNGGYHLRWFTPAVEVDLCGHATLATSHVLKQHLNDGSKVFRFFTRSGELQVRCEDDQYIMNFPALPSAAIDPPQLLVDLLGKVPLYVSKRMDYLVRLESQEEVEEFQPDMSRIAQLDARGLIITAPGRKVDFVSRFFGPQSGVPEDPVTGSAHCILTPYWAQETGKTSFHARQLSKRGGHVWCELKEDRVELRGDAVTVMVGEMWI